MFFLEFAQSPDYDFFNIFSYISGVWQIRKCSLVSLKAHQPRQGQSPLAGWFFFKFFLILFVCLKHRQWYIEGTKEQVIENVKEIIVRRLGKFQKKHKTETSYDITTTTYKKNTLKNIAANETAIY
jgi:hypothetical protein